MATAAGGRSWLKRIFIAFAVLFGLLVVAAVVIPLVVNVDQYRPQILKIANDNINGKLDIGKLSLSIWGQVEIDIDGIALEDAAGQKLVSVEETYAQISFLSILAGKPKLVFRMEKPDISVVKDQQGRLNILSLVKETTAQDAAADKPTDAQTPAAEPEPAATGGEIPLLGLISAAGVNIELRNADIQFKDLTSGFIQNVNELNVLLSDISMSRPMELKIWADIATKMADVVSLQGPFAIDGTITPEFNGVEFQQVGINMQMNFDDIGIDMGDTFQKPAGLPTNIALKMAASPELVDIQELAVRFHNAVLNAKVQVSNLQATTPVIDFDLKSQPIDLSEWGKLVTALKALELEGRMDLNAAAKGPLNELDYNAGLYIQDLIASAPGLLARPKMQVGVEIVTNEVRKLDFDFEAPGTDIAVRGSLKDFAAPNVRIAVNSRAIDLDQLIPPPSEQAPGAANPAGDQKVAGDQGAGSGGQGGALATDVDKSLDPLRNSELLKSVDAAVMVRIGKFKGMKLEAGDIQIDLSFKQLVAAISRFSVKVFKGVIKANADVDLKPGRPIYSMGLSVNQLDIRSAVESQLQSFRNTILGRLSFKAQGGGKSLNSDLILKNLDMNGNFKVAEAKFATVDAGKMIVEGINKSVGDIKKKVPPLADRSVKTPDKFRSRYKEISSGFALKGGVFSAPNFKTVSYEKEGIDIEGKTVADLVNDKIDASWLVIDTYNVTKARDVSVNFNGVKVDHILADGDKPVSFPVNVGCKLSEPCYRYDLVAKHLTKIALNNVRNAAKGKVDKEIKQAKEKARKKIAEKKKAAEKKAKKKAKKKLKKEADKLKKRFGF